MLTSQEFSLFRNLIYQESGIHLRESRKDFLENRLMKRMREVGISSPYWYYRLLGERNDELVMLLDQLTINETSFFRNRPQFELLQNVILPRIIHKKRDAPRKSLRIWSAGCSTGEESYSIAMFINETIQDTNSWDIKIYASDLSLTALEYANKGEYDKDKVHATVDDYYVAKYFKNTSDRYRVEDGIKRFVIFDYHNLKNDNGLRDFDVIFCRNVMIYFDEEEQKRLTNKFYKSLNQDGYLLLGHAESLQGWETGFEFVYYNKGTAYKKSEREE